MKSIFLLFISFMIFSCSQKGLENQSDLSSDIPITLKANNCKDIAEKNIQICLDSVLNDSRCPTGVVCAWEGDAIARFTIKVDNETKLFELHSHHNFQTDTLINGYTIKLISLSPYPSTSSQIEQKDYSAEITIIEQ